MNNQFMPTKINGFPPYVFLVFDGIKFSSICLLSKLLLKCRRNIFNNIYPRNESPEITVTAL